MEYLQILLDNFPVLQWSDLFDILIVGFLIYKLFPIFKSTGTVRIAVIVAIVLVATWLTELLELRTLHFLLSQVVAVGLIAIVVLFQPELRRTIDHMSNIKFKDFFGKKKTDEQMLSVIEQTVRACEVMSREKVGALIVFARHNRLDDHFKTGTLIDGQVSEHLLRNVFIPKASLHDGAVIICDCRIAAAGCVLPLSDSDRISADLGTRHRAALGMSEASDAVVVVVSEETGAISVAVGGVLKRHLAPQTLSRLLRTELCPELEDDKNNNIVVTLRQKLQKKKGDKENEE